MAYVREGHGRVKPKWRQGTHKPEGKRIGIELEIENRQGFDKILEAIPDTDNDDLRPVAERDGSLGDATGVEIVFPPYSHGSLRLKGSFFGRAVAALEEAGCHAHNECGMHMNVNTTGWGEAQKRAFVCWLHWVKPRALVNIGGRMLNHWCQQYTDITWDGAMQHTVHVTCAGVRQNRVEVRFPKATLDHAHIKNLVNFFSHLEDWCALNSTQQYLRDLRRTARRHDEVLQKFCEYLDTRVKRSRSAALIKEILMDGY